MAAIRGGGVVLVGVIEAGLAQEEIGPASQIGELRAGCRVTGEDEAAIGLNRQPEGRDVVLDRAELQPEATNVDRCSRSVLNQIVGAIEKVRIAIEGPTESGEEFVRAREVRRASDAGPSAVGHILGRSEVRSGR